MNRRWFNLLAAAVLGLLIPAILLATVSGKYRGDSDISTGQSEAIVTDATGASSENITVDRAISVAVLTESGQVEHMLLNDYVLRVVLAEMPASFEAEALKAQAVVARTYTLRRHQGAAKHETAAVCTDPSCCQGYKTEQSYLNGNGTVNDLNKIRQAVEDTGDLVLVYDGALIEATYFSCSGGITEDAAAVWGEDIPYLQATQSPGEEHATHYTDTMYFTAAEFKNLIGANLPGNAGTWIGKITYTNGKGVDTIEIGGNEYTGTELRSLLGLRSTAFTITAVGESIVITTKGYGHRVGMSQYGADAMAVQGKSFQEILMHYYNGAQLICYMD